MNSRKREFIFCLNRAKNNPKASDCLKCMKTNTKKIIKIAQNSLIWLVCLTFLVLGQSFAANTPTFNQTINAGSLSVDIVDAGGTTVGSPSVTFGAATYSFGTQDATGTLAPTAQRIRVYNPTATATWVVNLAASSPTASWTAGSSHYDFNDAGGYTDDGATTDADSYAGQMTVDPDTNGTISGVSGCATTNVSKGSIDSFVETSNNSIDILTAASGTATYCRWDYVSSDTNVTQKIPAGQAAGSYSISMALTIS